MITCDICGTGGTREEITASSLVLHYAEWKDTDHKDTIWDHALDLCEPCEKRLLESIPQLLASLKPKKEPAAKPKRSSG